MVALDKLQFNTATDRLFSAGDLVDKGQEHRNVVSLLDQNWFFSTRGNHDQFIIDQFDSERILTSKSIDQHSPQLSHLKIGGGWFYHLPQNQKRWFYQRLKQLPYVIEIETPKGSIGICHAGVHADIDHWDDFLEALHDKDIREKTLRWRKAVKMDMRHVTGIYQTFHGHTTQKKIRQVGNTFFIDTFEKTKHFTFVQIN